MSELSAKLWWLIHHGSIQKDGRDRWTVFFSSYTILDLLLMHHFKKLRLSCFQLKLKVAARSWLRWWAKWEKCPKTWHPKSQCQVVCQMSVFRCQLFVVVGQPQKVPRHPNYFSKIRFGKRGVAEGTGYLIPHHDPLSSKNTPTKNRGPAHSLPSVIHPWILDRSHVWLKCIIVVKWQSCFFTLLRVLIPRRKLNETFQFLQQKVTVFNL